MAALLSDHHRISNQVYFCFPYFCSVLCSMASSSLKPSGSNDIGWRWNYFKDERRKEVICVFCKHPSSGITRAKKHQAGITGDVKPCTKTPPDVKQILQDHFDEKQAAKDASSGPAKEFPMPTPASAPIPDSTKGQKKGGRQYESGSKVVLSPMPISSALPVTADFSASTRGEGFNDFEDDGTSYSIGSHFTHHAFKVNSGEDVAARISLLALEFHSISILSGSGTISSFTLGSSDSCSEILKYEGIFDLLSLTGSFEPNKDGLTDTRSGMLTASLAFRNGQVIQGQLAGSLVAAGPVKVVVASFCPPKKRAQERGKETANQS